jgi:putative hydrolase of HD superfamily
MRNRLMDRLKKDLLELASLCLSFGSVNRLTCHQDGETPESDSTHTVMLGIIACELAEEFYPSLDRGVIAQLALIHDIHEATAGDTQTLRISADEQQSKQEREWTHIRNLIHKFSSCSWLTGALTAYHSQVIPEARFLRAVDKNLPKLTHLLNDLAVLRRMGITKEEFKQRMIIRQSEELADYAGDFDKILELHRLLADEIYSKLPVGTV